MILDLNAKRAARAAKRGEGMQMILGDQTFDLVDELPIEIGEMAANNRIGEAFRMMLADPDRDWERLKSCRPSFNDVMDVVEYFGAALGESVRSSEPSPTTGQPLRLTSTATTDDPSLATVSEIGRSTPDDSSPTSDISQQSPPTDAS